MAFKLVSRHLGYNLATWLFGHDHCSTDLDNICDGALWNCVKPNTTDNLMEVVSQHKECILHCSLTRCRSEE